MFWCIDCGRERCLAYQLLTSLAHITVFGVSGSILLEVDNTEALILLRNMEQVVNAINVRCLL